MENETGLQGQSSVARGAFQLERTIPVDKTAATELIRRAMDYEQARILCNPGQREVLVEAALELGLKGPGGRHFDIVDFWINQNLFVKDGPETVGCVTLAEGDHEGDPVLTRLREPRWLTGVRDLLPEEHPLKSPP